MSGGRGRALGSEGSTVTWPGTANPVVDGLPEGLADGDADADAVADGEAAGGVLLSCRIANQVAPPATTAAAVTPTRRNRVLEGALWTGAASGVLMYEIVALADSARAASVAPPHDSGGG
jgi:hypothetical protein